MKISQREEASTMVDAHDLECFTCVCLTIVHTTLLHSPFQAGVLSLKYTCIWHSSLSSKRLSWKRCIHPYYKNRNGVSIMTFRQLYQSVGRHAYVHFTRIISGDACLRHLNKPMLVKLVILYRSLVLAAVQICSIFIVLINMPI